MSTDRDSPRNPLLDPRVAGAGGLLVTAAAVAFLLTHAPSHDPAPGPTVSVSVTASTASR